VIINVNKNNKPMSNPDYINPWLAAVIVSLLLGYIVTQFNKKRP